MTREQVIKGLESCLQGTYELCKECPYHEFYPNKCKAEREQDALELLKEQETMMQCIKGKCRICPHCSNCDVDDDGELEEAKPIKMGDLYFCGECKNVLAKMWIFCPMCGRKVKWE